MEQLLRQIGLLQVRILKVKVKIQNRGGRQY